MAERDIKVGDLCKELGITKSAPLISLHFHVLSKTVVKHPWIVHGLWQ
jgi:hypothetical protein